MEIKHIIKVRSLLISIFYLFGSATTIQNGQKKIEIIWIRDLCDFDRSIDFEGIKKMKSHPCSRDFEFKDSVFYDSVVNYIKVGKLIKDTSGIYRAYGYNLDMYVGAFEHDSLIFEFGIDHWGYIFFNNKTYLPSKELNYFLCAKTKLGDCLSNK